jgi:Ser/Thr protein kinase RdoA (MazF antagonist)
VKIASPKPSAVLKVGALLSPFIPMREGEAVDLARTLYSVSGQAMRLATEKDDTFCLNGVDGRRFILKISNPAEAPTEVLVQIRLIQHVTRADPSLPLPRVIPDGHGQVLTEIVDSAGQRRQARLLSYLEGIPLDRTSSSGKEREAVGRILGKLRVATAGFSCAGDSRLLAWDVRHLLSLRPLLSEVGDEQHRQQLTRGMERFESLYDRIVRLRTQVLHNDFSKSNLIVDHDDPSFVTGIIDFGDAVRTAVAVDVATALLNHLPKAVKDRPDAELFIEAKDVLRGYLSITELTDEELFLLPHLVMGRIITRALITLRRARSFPENSAYILRNTRQGWAQLDWFLRHSIDEVSSSLAESFI